MHSSVFCSCPTHASERRQYQTFQCGQKRLPSASQQLESALYTKTISLNAHKPSLLLCLCSSLPRYSGNTTALSRQDICSASLLPSHHVLPHTPAVGGTGAFHRKTSLSVSNQPCQSLFANCGLVKAQDKLSAGCSISWAGRTWCVYWDTGYPYKALLRVCLWHNTI